MKTVINQLNHYPLNNGIEAFKVLIIYSLLIKTDR